MGKPEHELCASDGNPFTIEDLNVRGRILAPGTITAMVDGKPARLHVSREVILEAYDELRAFLAQNQKIEMMLAHPGVGDMPLRWGDALDFLANRDAGEVYLAASKPTDDMRNSLTPEGIAKLATLGLSIRGPLFTTDKPDGSFDVTRLRMRGVDIVGKGGFPGSGVAASLPKGLAAMLAQLPNDREADDPTNSGRRSAPTQPHGDNTMEVPEAEVKTLRAQAAEVPKLESELKELRAQLAQKMTDATANETAVKELRAQVGTLDTRIKDLAAQATTAREEKEAILAAQDVDHLVSLGKVMPAARDETLAIRKSVPPEVWSKYADKLPVLLKAGEKGNAGTAAKPEVTKDQEAAHAAVETAGGVAEFLRQGLPISEPIATYLLAQHAEVPQVKAREKTLKAIAPKAVA